MTLLVIDVTAIIIASITGFFSLASLIVTLLLKGRVDSYKKDVDGMKTELVAAVKGQYQAEGELKGAADQKKESSIKTGSNPVEVNIVDQTKPVEVTSKPKK